MDEACGHTPDLGLDYAPHTVTATPKRSTNPVDNVAGQHYNCHQYCTPTTARLLSRDACSTASLPSPCSGSTQAPGCISGHRLRTPVSSGSSRRGLLTPQHMTPRGKMQVYNPFESPLMDRLQDQLDFSPNMFVETIPEEKSPETFQWSIDQLATLQPVEIEENEIETQCKYYYQNRDHHNDMKAQNAIDEYFTHNHIAPSPWSDNSKNKVHELPRTPGVHSAESPMVLQIKHSRSKNNGVTLLKEAGSQTELSLPKDFDLQKVLGEHYCKMSANEEAATADDEGTVADNLSSSSLRRKLFFQGAKNSMFSPRRMNHSADLTISPKVSPQPSPVFNRKTLQRGQLMASGLETPESGSNLFSSSPIHGHGCREAGPLLFMTPSLRRCSTAPEIADSPEFSPITLGNKDDLLTPSSSSLVQCTPQSCRPQKIFRSPGMSPIVGANGSFMSSSQYSRDNSSRMHASDPKMRLPFQVDELDLKDDSIQQMEYDDPDEDKTCDPHFNTQDTGYQTNSLQSTNMDAVSASNMTGLEPVLPNTNLTVQFGNMCGNDTGTDLEYQPPIPRKVTSLISPTFTLIKNYETHADDFAVLSDCSALPSGDSGRPHATGVPVFPWKPEMMKRRMEGKSAVIKEKITGHDSTSVCHAPRPASEVARLALLRAGEDYDKFCIQKLYSHHDSPLKSGVESMSFDL